MPSFLADSPAGTSQSAYTAKEINGFLRFFCSAMFSVGSNTSRINRNAMRIAEAYGFKAEMVLFSRHLMISVTSQDGRDHYAAIGSLQAGSPDFKKLAKLNALGWRMVDKRLDLREAMQNSHAILGEPRYNLLPTGFMAACANASFCHLFGGDPWAMLIVFSSTLAVFWLRLFLLSRKLDGRITLFICAYAVSLLISPAVMFEAGSTAQTALASGVLFLIPGIPMINTVLDILDGHILMGLSRGIQAGILITCITLGLSLCMFITGISAL